MHRYNDPLIRKFPLLLDPYSQVQNALGIYRGYEPVPATMLQLEVWGSDNGTYVTVKQTQNLRSREVRELPT